MHVHLIPYLVHIGHPGITSECTPDINQWVSTHIKKWTEHPVRKGFVFQESGGKYKLNKLGWEELLRFAEIVVSNGVVRLMKRKGVN